MRKLVIKGIILLIVAILVIAGIFAVRRYFLNKRMSVRSVEMLQDEPSLATVIAAPGVIPDYSGEDVLVINENVPNFTPFDISHIKGETYSQLDDRGRCGSAYALLDRSMMPTEDRGSIGMIKPSGWNQAKYPGLVDSDPPYLFNRCHLIAYALTGQNDNERNLITGTRYLNATLMLPYEIQVAQYLDRSDNHVLYRVTPFFRENELVARGVEIEAYSVEDNGNDIMIHVFLYNVQPGIEIDYKTGESREE